MKFHSPLCPQILISALFVDYSVPHGIRWQSTCVLTQEQSHFLVGCVKKVLAGKITSNYTSVLTPEKSLMDAKYVDGASPRKIH
jgi:sorbitol-specific phosphotransferase system component IIC